MVAVAEVCHALGFLNTRIRRSTWWWSAHRIWGRGISERKNKSSLAQPLESSLIGTAKTYVHFNSSSYEQGKN